MITSTIYCAICDQMLRDFSKKKICYHQQYHEKNYFKCELCEFAFNTSDLLEFHRKRRHGPTTWIIFDSISAKLFSEGCVGKEKYRTWKLIYYLIY